MGSAHDSFPLPGPIQNPRYLPLWDIFMECQVGIDCVIWSGLYGESGMKTHLCRLSERPDICSNSWKILAMVGPF